jgi:phosphoribosylformylglycinamidine synthase
METDAVVGVQDMGAAGLTSSAVEMADRGDVGIRIDVDEIPAREEGMNAFEFLLSESQERMLVVVDEGREETLAEIFDEWELEWARIGEVVEGDRFEVLEDGEQVVDLGVGLLTSEAPTYQRPMERPTYLEGRETPSIPEPEDLEATFARLMGRPNVASARSVYEQYDHMVGVGTVVRPGEGDGAVLRIPETNRAFAIASDCNSRYCYLDPREGARLAVAECARNLSCVGAEPVGTTDCMNFGNPENPEIMWQFKEAIEGMAEACRWFDTPVVSGNVSLYNATDDGNIYPTPSVAMVGRFEAPLGTGAKGGHFCTMGFERAGDDVWLLGETDLEDLGGSEYLWMRTDELGARPPQLDLEREAALEELVRELIAEDSIENAHDCSEGGLGAALAECCMRGSPGLGVELELESTGRSDLELFAESPSRILVSAPPERADRIEEAAGDCGVPADRIGTVQDDGRLRWSGKLDVAVSRLEATWEAGLDRIE